MPTRRSRVPSARPPSTAARSEAPALLVSRAIRSGRAADAPGTGTSRPASRRAISEACCSARTSVGAMRAPWWPPSTATSNAASATTVLPDPTSPWSRRCMGRGPARSSRSTATACAWAAVNAKGNPSTNRSSRVGPPSARTTTWRMPRASSCNRRRRSTMASWSRSSSSKARRLRAGSTASMVAGRWMPANAAVRSMSPSVARASDGTGSANRPARSRASCTSRPMRAEVSAAFSVRG